MQLPIGNLARETILIQFADCSGCSAASEASSVTTEVWPIVAVPFWSATHGAYNPRGYKKFSLFLPSLGSKLRGLHFFHQLTTGHYFTYWNLNRIDVS